MAWRALPPVFEFAFLAIAGLIAMTFGPGRPIFAVATVIVSIGVIGAAVSTRVRVLVVVRPGEVIVRRRLGRRTCDWRRRAVGDDLTVRPIGGLGGGYSLAIRRRVWPIAIPGLGGSREEVAAIRRMVGDVLDATSEPRSPAVERPGSGQSIG